MNTLPDRKKLREKCLFGFTVLFHHGAATMAETFDFQQLDYVIDAIHVMMIQQVQS